MHQQASVQAPSPLANSGFRTAGRQRQLISLTPLIDVVFILLVFFMLASSFLDWRAIELSAPGASSGGEPLEDAVLVEVRKDGIRLSGEALTREALVQRMRDLLARDADRRVLVKTSDGVVMQETVAVLDRLTAAGVTDLSLIADPAR